MAKVKILNLKSVLKKVEDLFLEDVRSNELLKEIKDFTILRVQAETRKGRDLSKNGREHDPLNPKSTIPFRKRLLEGKVKNNHPWWFEPDRVFFRPAKSNLTSTGQMLESLDGRITKSKGEVIVEPTGQRDPSLQFDNSIKTNKALAKDLASRGRTFLGLDDTGVKRIKKLILDEIRRFKRKRGFNKR